MQELQPILDELAILADYEHLIVAVTLILLLLVFYVSIRASKTSARRFIQTRKDGAKVTEAVNSASVKMQEQLAGVTRQSATVIDAVRKGMREELNVLHNAINDSINDSVREDQSSTSEILESVKTALAENKESYNSIKALFEQQGVFLHDRFSELGSGGGSTQTSGGADSAALSEAVAALRDAQDKRLTEIQQQLSDHIGTLRDGQDKRFTELQQQLGEKIASQQSSSGGGSSVDISTLRDGLTADLSKLLREERGLQQESQNSTTALISDSMNRLTDAMDAKLALMTDKMSSRFNDSIAGTMQSFQTLQGQIDTLLTTKNEIDALGRDVITLTKSFISKSDGPAGSSSQHLPDMLATILPGDAYLLNPVINGRMAAAQLMLPGEQGAIIIDDKLPLDTFSKAFAPAANDAARIEARQQFANVVASHINHIADHFITPPATGGSALMFVPSEAAFAEIQGHHQECVNLAIKRQVWMVSPTTLIAALNMARNALKDQKARVQLEKMRHSLQQIAQEAQTFEARLLEIGDHVNNAMRSVQRAEHAGVKLFGDVRGMATAAIMDEPGGSGNDGGIRTLPNTEKNAA